jgi:hypothetical protein
MMEDFISVTSLAFGNLALQFDGSNDYVQAIDESAFDLTTSMTIELWIKPESLVGMQGLISKHFGNNAHPYQIRLEGDEITFGFYSNTIGWQPVETYNANLPLNEWSHIACTYDMVQAKIYVNGIQKASANKSFEIPQNDQAFEIGRTKDLSFEYFNGIIDEVRVWEIARTAEEVAENMCTNYTGMTVPGLVTNYKFNECGGTLLTDSQNGNDAILIGMEGDEWLESDACPVYNIDFTVTADPGAIPIEGATISLNGTIRYTDDSGQANFEGYETGMYEYSVIADGFEMASGDFELVNENVSIEVTLILNDIEDITSDKIVTWPNPVNGVLNIQTPVAYNLEIMDIYGRVVLTGTLEPGTSQIDLSDQLPGVYYLNLTMDGQVRIEKIMVW